MSGKRLVRKHREPNLMSDVYEPENGPEQIFADGFAGIDVSAGHIKIGLHWNTGAHEESGTRVEERLLHSTLTMPLDVWLELCASTFSGFFANKVQVTQMLDAHRAKIMGIVDSLQVHREAFTEAEKPVVSDKDDPID